MPSMGAIRQAILLAVDTGLLSPSSEPERQAAAWAATLSADMPDDLLADTMRRLAAGDVKTYGSVKPADVNRLAASIRAERVAAWTAHRECLTERRDPVEQAAYYAAFYRAIGNGKGEVLADQEARAAVNMVNAVMDAEPGTPPYEVLTRFRDALARGHTPWVDNPAALPPPRHTTSSSKRMVRVAPPVTMHQIEQRARKEGDHGNEGAR